ncbi:MAG: hypothetical protein Q4E67_04075, partial [Planctomycetia bacterium]|nr:hypothetical protein [Planctomycetia bacterium]
KAYIQKPSEDVRDFLYFGAQMFYQIKFLDSTMAILNKIMADYPNCAREYRAYAVVYLTINPSRVPDFLQVAEQCPDSKIYQASIYTTKALYDFFVDENPDATLEDLAKLEEIGKLNIEMQYFRFLILMKREGMTVERLKKYLPTCKPKNEKEEWLIFSIRLNFLCFQKKWQEILDLLQTHSKFRITQEKTYLHYLLYAKYMQENSDPPSDEKVFFTKYGDELIPSFIPYL